MAVAAWRSCSGLLLRSSFTRRSYTTLQEEENVLHGLKGLVLGSYYNKDKGLEFTPAAKQFDEKCNSKLSSLAKKFCPKLGLGECQVFYDVVPEYAGVALVGLGSQDALLDDSVEERNEQKENIRIAAGAGSLQLHKIGFRYIELDGCTDDCAAAEGSQLALFKYNEHKSKKTTSSQISLFQGSNSAAWQQGMIASAAQNFARELMETPANFMTPKNFVEIVSEHLKAKSGLLTVTPRSKEWIESKSMGAFLSVAKGSAEEPWLFEAHYHGGPSDQPPLVLIGKGVTFDTGGISLKPSANMDRMRADMGGAACVVSVVSAASALQLPMNIVVLAPLCENMPSACALKPGDVVKAMDGQTIQVDNTDAEGRLILADALCYSESFKPAAVVDVATLTGAIDVALGTGAAAVYTNCSKLWEQLHMSGKSTGDRLWRMPLFDQYSKQMKSHLADINNIGTSSRSAGSCTAAAFLRKFVSVPSWAHLDIAGVMESKGEISYLQKGMSGRPTRTLIEFAKIISEDKQ